MRRTLATGGSPACGPHGGVPGFLAGFPGGKTSGFHGRPAAGRDSRLLAGLGLLAVFVGGCGRLSGHPLLPAAREEVSTNPRVVELLAGPGGKVECGSAVKGRSNETDGLAALEFEAQGPRGRGTVVVEGKKVGGSWGVTRLELRPAAGGDPLVLTADLEARTGVDTPRFDPAAAATTPSAVPPPPGDIEIKLPPGGPQ